MPTPARSRGRLSLATLLTLVLAAPAVGAHGAGGGASAQVEPLPAWLLWAAGALVVLASFALVSLLFTRGAEPRRRADTLVDAGDVTGVPRGLVGALRLGGLALLALVIAAGLVPWDPGEGARRLVWLLLWGVLPVLAYGLGNVWALASPFRALAGLAERLRAGTPPFAYPDGAKAWPSVVLVLALVGLEVAAPSSAGLGRAALAYTTFTVVGMATYGSEVWLSRAEAFDRAFAWWATVAPGRLTAEGWTWRAPGAGLDRVRGLDGSDAAFVVALLYGVKAEAFLATAPGAWLVDALGVLGGPVARAAVALLGYLAFLAVFALAVWGVRVLTRTRLSVHRLAGALAVTLVPIAVGYHLAHNLPHLVDEAPLLFEALVDPLALGDAQPLGLLAAGGLATGAVQAGLVLAGHVAGVLAAHARSFSLFDSAVQAAKAELVLTVAMAAYTTTSLWILHAAAGGLP